MISEKECLLRLWKKFPKEKDYIQLFEYNGVSNKAKIRCTNCNTIRECVPRNLYDGTAKNFCQVCYPILKEATLQNLEKAKSIIDENDGLTFIGWKMQGRGESSHQKLSIQYSCKLCDKINDIFISDHKDKGRLNIECTYCQGNCHNRDGESFDKQLQNKYDGLFQMVDTAEYKANNQKVKVRCKCGFIFSALPISLLRERGVKCPKCQNGYSKAEIKIYNSLLKREVSFEIQKNFDWLPNSHYRYDFYLPEQKLLLEFHGEQHYKHCLFFHQTEEKFLQAKNRDEIKKQLALKNDYNLIVIPYQYSMKIDAILNKIFGSTTISKESRGKFLEVDNIFLEDDDIV